jgi:hypothetical protein
MKTNDVQHKYQTNRCAVSAKYCLPLELFLLILCVKGYFTFKIGFVIISFSLVFIKVCLSQITVIFARLQFRFSIIYVTNGIADIVL